MSFLATHCRRLNLYAKCFRAPAVSVICNRHAAYDSTLFPGYKVVYVLDNIQRVSSINRLKYRASIVTGVLLPGVYALTNLYIMNFDIAIVVSFYSLTATLFLHSVGLFCNNVVGYIYANQKEQEIKVSYVDFWGKRINVDGKYADLEITDASNWVFRSLFNNLKIKSHDKVLKFCTKGKILDDKIFDKICGINFQ